MRNGARSYELRLSVTYTRAVLARTPPRAPFGLLLWIAVRDLRASATTSVLLICAVAVGVGFQIPNAANLNGYTAELLHHGIAAGYGDVRVRPLRGERFADGDGIAARVGRVPGVTAVSAVLMLPGAVGRAGQFLSLPIAGVDTSARGGTRPYRLVAGADLAREDPSTDATGDPALSPKLLPELLIGASAAERLGVRVGERVTLQVILSSAPRLVLDDVGLGRYELAVRGIVGGNFGAFDPVFVSRRFLTSEVGAPGAASIVFAYTDDHFAAPELARRIGAALPETTARDWMEDAPFLRASIHASRVIGALSQSMVFFAVAIPVMALLYISMLARRRQLAILAAMGFSQGEVFLTFLLQTLIVGVLGSVAGLAIGAASIVYFVGHPIFAWHAFIVHPTLSARVVLRTVLLAFAATVGAGIYPAWRAACTDPVAVLRDGE